MPIANKTVTILMGAQSFTVTTNAVDRETGTSVPERINQPLGSSPCPPRSLATMCTPPRATRRSVHGEQGGRGRLDDRPSWSRSTPRRTQPEERQRDSINLILTVDEVNDGYPQQCAPCGCAASGLLGLNNARPIQVNVTRVSNGALAKTCPATTRPMWSAIRTPRRRRARSPTSSDTYQVDATIQGDYFVGTGIGALVVYDPALGFITGGGWYTNDRGSRQLRVQRQVPQERSDPRSLLVSFTARRATTS